MGIIKIGITLDDVLRAKTFQFGKIYKKYQNENVELDKINITSGNLAKAFGFNSNSEYIKFLYEDYPFEIFGEAGMVEKNLDKDLNLWHLSINDDDEIDDEIQLVLMNPREFNASIGYTYFFLSKMATRIREVYFPEDYMSIWDKCDILITADKKLLEQKPNGKKSVKINTAYNENAKSDFVYDSMTELIKDENFLKNVINKK